MLNARPLNRARLNGPTLSFTATPAADPEIRDAVRSILAGSTAIAARVAARIYPAPRPQSAVLPCLTYRLITGNPGHDLGAADGTVRARFQVEAWAATQAVASAMQREVFAALDGYIGTVEGVRITWAAQLDANDLSDLEALGTGNPNRRIVLDYLVQYRVAIPSR